MDDDGNFRIVYGRFKSEWTSYRNICILKLPSGGTFMAVSQYFEGLNLVPERVYHIQLLNSNMRIVKGVRPE